MRTWPVLVALLAVAGPAHADAESDARTFFNIGAKAYQGGKYLDAAHAFEEAYKRSPRPGLLFSLGQAHRMQFFANSDPARLRDAVRYYREYLKKEPNGRRRGEATEALGKLVPLLERLDAEGGGEAAPPPPPAKPRVMISSPTPGVRISFDGRRVPGSTYVSEVPPGKHSVKLTAPGFEDYSRQIVVDASTGAPPLDIALKEKPARLAVAAPEGAEIAIDGRYQGIAPLPPLDVPAGQHFVAVTLNGHEAFTRKLEVERGRTYPVRAHMPTTGQRTTSWILMGVGASGIVAGGVLGALSIRKENQAQDIADQANGSGNLSPAKLGEYDALRSRRDSFRLAAIVSASAGLAVGATGFVLYAFDQPRVQVPELDRNRRPASTPGSPAAPTMEISAAPVWTQDYSGAALFGRF